jgi:phage terminase small subunit
MENVPTPPEHLSDRAKTLWHAVLAKKKAVSEGRLAMIQAALEALDRADQCRALIAEQGLTTVTKTTGAVHVNPLTKIERESRAMFLASWRIAGLSFDPNVDGRA